MTYLKRTLQPEIYLFVCALAVAAIVAAGLYVVTTVHAANATKREACRIAAESLVKQRPFLRHTVRTVDDCIYLRRLKGDDV